MVYCGAVFFRQIIYSMNSDMITIQLVLAKATAKHMVRT